MDRRPPSLPPDLRLVPASLETPDCLEAFLAEIGEGEAGFGGELEYVSGRKSIEELLQSLVEAEAGRGLPEGWVPCTTSWLLDGNGSVIGMSRLRHALTPFLTEKGGNIGYYVRRAERGRGLGTALLAGTLALARELGLERVMIAAYADNEPSLRVIEANGGVLEDEREADDHRYRRYWIELA